MDLVLFRSVLGWCTLINYGLLLLWFLMFTMAHDWMYKFHSKWFSISVDKFDLVHYASMSFFKLSWFILNLVPYIALHIVG